MATTIDTPSTDLVVLDDSNALTDSDNEGSPSAALIGSAALAAGVAIGAFVVPPVVGFVKNLFSKSTPAVVTEIEPTVPVTETPAEKAV